LRDSMIVLLWVIIFSILLAIVEDGL